MNDQLNMKSLVFAWAGVLASAVALQTAQIVIGLAAGTMTCIYTFLKIIEWLQSNRKK